MRLIEKVEVAYFRSFYKDQVDGCVNTNVIFGRNDSGKSNLLRALNLFFNNETSPGTPFRFDLDLNHSRRAEAEAPSSINVRKFVYVKVWFNTPENWRASLGDQFWVKKQWSVTTERDPHLEWSATRQRGEAQRQYVTRFLNKIQFHYVPAIKDRKIFEGLQADIYKVVSQHEEFRGSLVDFADALRARTFELSEGLLDKLHINSAVSPPQDLTDLFKSLDFETTSESGDFYSLTLQRGDGIQVRHIPLILAFLSDRSAYDFHVWGFEEPENSLELATAIEEAETFRSFGLESNKQIFLTSHSPAFFSLAGDDVSKHFVSRSLERMGRLNSKISKVSEGDISSDLMGETPHLPLISHYLREAHALIERGRRDQQLLEEQLAHHNSSMLFVEGESDRLVIEKAWEVIVGGERPFVIVETNGTTKMKSLAVDGAVLTHLAPGRKILVLVDNDREGRELKVDRGLGDGGQWRLGHNGVNWCRLPFNPQLRSLMTSLGVPQAFWPGTLENLFPTELRAEAIAEGVLEVGKLPFDELRGDHLGYVVDYLHPTAGNEHLLVLSPSGESKVGFAQWLVRKFEDVPLSVEPLRDTILALQRVLEE